MIIDLMIVIGIHWQESWSLKIVKKAEHFFLPGLCSIGSSTWSAVDPSHLNASNGRAWN